MWACLPAQSQGPSRVLAKATSGPCAESCMITCVRQQQSLLDARHRRTWFTFFREIQGASPTCKRGGGSREQKTKKGRRRQSALKRAGAAHVGFPRHNAQRVRHPAQAPRRSFSSPTTSTLMISLGYLALHRHSLARLCPDTLWLHLIQSPRRRRKAKKKGRL